MGQRYVQDTQKVLFLAREEAGRLGTRAVSSEHLLLGLIRDEDCAGALLLAHTLKISLGHLRAAIERHVTFSRHVIEEELPFTPEAQAILTHAKQIAGELGAAAVDTRHLLLAIASSNSGLGAQACAELSVSPDAIRQHLTPL